MNVQLQRGRADPIVAEVLRTRLEAIGQEAGAAVEQTAISPIVTESKDYSVTICDAAGALISATGVVELHFGAAAHAVRCTIERYGDDIGQGDLFIANDPHSGGGLHPQDVVVQQPVFVEGQLVAWVALAAHMMDMGGMVPGSSAVMATECFQEALRLPPVRLKRRGEEITDVWDIMRTNIRTAHLVEMDLRSLVIGAHVAETKLEQLIGGMGAHLFAASARLLIDSAEKVLRDHISAIEDGSYSSTAWVEWGDSLFKVPCKLEVMGDRIRFDLREAPPQTPHFFNSKDYIIRAVMTPLLRQLLAPGLPLNQAIYSVVELLCTPGTLVHSLMPAPIAAAHMDAAGAVASAAIQCLQLAIHASPNAGGRQFNTAPLIAAYGTGRWSYRGEGGQRHVFTIIDGAFAGSAAAQDRDGVDLNRSLIPAGSSLEYADIEILEAVYPLIFHERRNRIGDHGYGEYRSGSGCLESFGPHGIDEIVGNMTGTRAWFPGEGAGGGLPGATTRFRVHRASGAVEEVKAQSVGVTVGAGDRFETSCASGGGFGDPLERTPARVIADMRDRRLDRATAEAIYGIALTPSGELDEGATEARREALRAERLAAARPPLWQAEPGLELSESPALPLYPGVVQRGPFAVADRSGAILAIAPGDWLDGCAVLDSPIRVGEVQLRCYFDPLSGRQLYAGVHRSGERSSIAIAPERWVRAAPREEARDERP